MMGKTLGHYRVGEQLGRGGMGEVYQFTTMLILRGPAAVGAAGVDAGGFIIRKRLPSGLMSQSRYVPLKRNSGFAALNVG
jgi:hypothetical protein